jgi:hypothetical protein
MGSSEMPQISGDRSGTNAWSYQERATLRSTVGVKLDQFDRDPPSGRVDGRTKDAGTNRPTRKDSSPPCGSGNHRALAHRIAKHLCPCGSRMARLGSRANHPTLEGHRAAVGGPPYLSDQLTSARPQVKISPRRGKSIPLTEDEP